MLRSRRINNSANFKNGSFTNLSPTKMKPDDVSYITMIRKTMNRPNSTRPGFTLPVVKTDLKALAPVTPTIIWFGHSSYLIHFNKKNILIDPGFSGYASPFSFMVKAFDGANNYSAADMPDIDLLIITHDHYDHLDVPTIKELAPKIKSVCTSLGVGERLEELLPGIKVTELDWWESDSFDDLKVTACPARHFSGRGLKRNGSLWSSFVINLPGYSIFAGGDSGYDFFFKEIGNRFGPFDIAMLECGQYNEMWPMIHMMPEQTAQAAKDLQTKWLLPVHWSKFALALHPWNEPVKRVKLAAEKLTQNITTPKIGEPVVLGKSYPSDRWYENSYEL
ncbi:MAG: MBL fold metallo-hydrolase [Chitinophagaceae bacterium]|nr:MAG: MBL fold metallo-hydrolase [Chitinophagaceae bacterium]